MKTKVLFICALALLLGGCGKGSEKKADANPAKKGTTNETKEPEKDPVKDSKHKVGDVPINKISVKILDAALFKEVIKHVAAADRMRKEWVGLAGGKMMTYSDYEKAFEKQPGAVFCTFGRIDPNQTHFTGLQVRNGSALIVRQAAEDPRTDGLNFLVLLFKSTNVTLYCIKRNADPFTVDELRASVDGVWSIRATN